MRTHLLYHHNVRRWAHVTEFIMWQNVRPIERLCIWDCHPFFLFVQIRSQRCEAFEKFNLSASFALFLIVCVVFIPTDNIFIEGRRDVLLKTSDFLLRLLYWIVLCLTIKWNLLIGLFYHYFTFILIEQRQKKELRRAIPSA